MILSGQDTDFENGLIATNRARRRLVGHTRKVADPFERDSVGLEPPTPSSPSRPTHQIPARGALAVR
jgi:hypothetical protein